MFSTRRRETQRSRLKNVSSIHREIKKGIRRILDSDLMITSKLTCVCVYVCVFAQAFPIGDGRYSHSVDIQARSKIFVIAVPQFTQRKVSIQSCGSSLSTSEIFTDVKSNLESNYLWGNKRKEQDNLPQFSASHRITAARKRALQI